MEHDASDSQPPTRAAGTEFALMRALHLFAPAPAAELIDAALRVGDAAAFVENVKNDRSAAPQGAGDHGAARQAAERAGGQRTDASGSAPGGRTTGLISVEKKKRGAVHRRALTRPRGRDPL